MPDPIGDLVINGVAADVYRRSFVNGIQEDTAYRLGYAHTLRFGFSVSRGTLTGEQYIDGVAAGRRRQCIRCPFPFSTAAPRPVGCSALISRTNGRSTSNLTLNAGLRFDQMYQYVDANQFSPRISLTWTPFEGTTFHAGYARNFTPPPQVLAAPTNLALVQDTTQQPAVSANDPVLPERSNVFDVGVVQKIYAIPGLEIGIDAYCKTARDMVDDGQFGAAYVLTAFNFARGKNVGIEFKSSYTNGNFRAYGNLAWRDRPPPASCRTSSCSTPTRLLTLRATTLTPTTPSFIPRRQASPISG